MALFLADSHFPPDLEPLLRSASAAPTEMSKAQTNVFRSLGHKLERFLAARALVHQRILQDETFAPLKPWLGKDGGIPASLKEDGTFLSAYSLSGTDIRLAALMLPPDLATKALALWRQTDPEAPKVLPALLDPPQDAAAPLWLALLRLRPLRSVWESMLRRDHFETLLQVLPDAWLLDPTPLPPGAVIPRLELASWENLPYVQREGRRFAIASPESWDGAQELGSHGTLQTALTNSATAPQTLMALPAAPDSWIIAVYEKKANRVDARGFLSLRRSPEGAWQAAKVR
ncbi:hypothetical protein DES53_109151 [Roseimicrobium gellanilyticum]|uniref:Uncharacterized protein n=1 Tax=Roseimicrobium gellanilyticum TaxID=748857 RepID=A0A366HDN1_9BACT|nr:hypothetical protein [Roseimicrobium gellanilyticum]RBP39724.1 hypothetical protein DES53_109151 [Roseimicrobium gellanilyticum]